MKSYKCAVDSIHRIEADISTLDYLLQFEKILEEAGMYGYENWEAGEVIEGPIITRYWVAVFLMYPLKLKPDVKAIPRLTKIGAKINYSQDVFVQPGRVTGPEDIADRMTMLAKKEKHKVWILEIHIPKQLIEDEIDEYVELDEIDINTDDIDSSYQENESLDSDLEDEDLFADDNMDNQLGDEFESDF